MAFESGRNDPTWAQDFDGFERDKDGNVDINGVVFNPSDRYFMLHSLHSADEILGWYIIHPDGTYNVTTADHVNAISNACYTVNIESSFLYNTGDENSFLRKRQEIAYFYFDNLAEAIITTASYVEGIAWVNDPMYGDLCSATFINGKDSNKVETIYYTQFNGIYFLVSNENAAKIKEMNKEHSSDVDKYDTRRITEDGMGYLYISLGPSDVFYKDSVYIVVEDLESLNAEEYTYVLNYPSYVRYEPVLPGEYKIKSITGANTGLSYSFEQDIIKVDEHTQSVNMIECYLTEAEVNAYNEKDTAVEEPVIEEEELGIEDIFAADDSTISVNSIEPEKKKAKGTAGIIIAGAIILISAIIIIARKKFVEE